MRVPALLRDISTAALQRESGLHGLIAYESKVFHMNARIPVATSLKKKKGERTTHSPLSAHTCVCTVDALLKKCFQYCHNNPGAQQARRFDENGTTPSVMLTVPDAQLRGLYTGSIARACTGFGKVARWTPL